MMLRDHGKTALIFNDEPVSYGEILSRAAAFAARYRIRRGDRVAVCGENRPEWIYAFYSVWMKGGVPVPLDAAAPPEDLVPVIADCGPVAALCSRACAGTVRQAARAARRTVTILVFEDLPRESADAPREIAGGAPGDTALILYTSGTTGPPKGVMLSFENLATCIYGITSLGMVTPEDRLIGLLPFHHIFPLQGTVIAPLCIGSTVVMLKSLVADEILGALRRHRVTIFLGVPKLYALFHGGIMRRFGESRAARIILAVMRRVNSNRLGALVFARVHRNFGGFVRAWLTGGAPLDAHVGRDLWAMGFRIVEGYGLTETAPLVAFNHYRRVRLGTVGLPMAGTEVRIENDEILVRGRNVMKGYYRNPAATAARIRDGWFHTGDRGLIDKEGYLRVTGRIDEMIVLPNGKNVDPIRIEERLLALSPYVSEAAVFARGGRLAAVLLPNVAALERDGVGAIVETLRRRVIDEYNSTVQPYRRISELVIGSDELPRTRLGKLKRYRLPDVATAEGMHSITIRSIVEGSAQ